jgi:hypothetical protein
MFGLIALSKDSNMHSAIVGDFNAKTGTPNDFIIPDETLLDLFNLDSDDVTDDCKVMCIGLCTSVSKGSKSCISNSFTKENNFDDIKK